MVTSESFKLDIIYEDDDVIAVNKPAGLTVHPKDSKDTQETLVSLLLKHYPPLQNIGDDPLRPGIVHRLDKDTSGIMAIAKNQNAFDYLKKQFQNREIEKKYLALIVGRLKNKVGLIEEELGRYGAKQRTKVRDTKIKEFRGAITGYRVLEEYLPSQSLRKQNLGGRDFSLVEAMPKTGRTHQIRVHFASTGHPIAGDKIYGFKNQPLPKGLTRQFLHAAYLKFSPKPGKVLAVRCDLPKDLKLVLKQLKF